MKDRVIALAGLCQALALVQQLAQTGQTESRPLATLLDSLFRMDANTAEAVFGDVRQLDRGLRTLLGLLGHGQRDPAVARMGLSVLNLVPPFLRNPDAIERVRQTLRDAERQREHLGPQHPTVLSRLGSLYAEQISPLGDRVVVQGNPVYLAQPPLVAEVRAILLCGLRAAVLWRQVGGSRWDFLFKRRQMIEEAQDLLSPLAS
jgi:high frequency lysogenization protein